MYWNRGDIPRSNRKLVLNMLQVCWINVFRGCEFEKFGCKRRHLQHPPKLHDEFALSLTEIFIELHMWRYALYQMKQKSHVKRARNCCNGRIRPTSSKFVQIRPTSSEFVRFRSKIGPCYGLHIPDKLIS